MLRAHLSRPALAAAGAACWLAVAAGPARTETLAGLELAAGDRLLWKSGRREFTEEVERVADGVATIRSTRDGSFVQPLEFALPTQSWSGAPDGTGRTEIIKVEGRLFPLAPGNRMRITYRGVSEREPEGWTRERVCSVGQPTQAKVPAGSFKVLPVTCQEASRSRRWLFAPELGLVVRYENAHRIEGGTMEELVAVERAGASP